MLSGKIVSRVLFISCIHSECIQIPWIAKDGGIVSHFHVASAQIQCIFNWILCVCYKQTPAPHLIKVSEVMTQKKERKKEILLFWVFETPKKVFDQIRIDSFVLSDDAKLSFRKSGEKVLKVDVRCALHRSTSGSDQTVEIQNIINTQILWTWMAEIQVLKVVRYALHHCHHQWLWSNGEKSQPSQTLGGKMTWTQCRDICFTRWKV